MTWLIMRRCIRILIVCNSILIFDLEQWFLPDSKMEEATLETQEWKG